LLLFSFDASVEGGLTETTGTGAMVGGMVLLLAVELDSELDAPSSRINLVEDIIKVLDAKIREADARVHIFHEL